MPSDAKKRDQARKKEAAKKRNQKITSVTSDELQNGTNGVNGKGHEPVELTEDGLYYFKIFNFTI